MHNLPTSRVRFLRRSIDRGNDGKTGSELVAELRKRDMLPTDAGYPRASNEQASTKLTN